MNETVNTKGSSGRRQVKTENLLSKRTQAVCCSLARLGIHRTGKIFQGKKLEHSSRLDLSERMCGPGQSGEQQPPQKAVQSGGMRPDANGPLATDNWETGQRKGQTLDRTRPDQTGLFLSKHRVTAIDCKGELAEWQQNIII